MLTRWRGCAAIGVALMLLGACTSKSSTNNHSPSATGQRGGTFSIFSCEANHLTPPLDYETCGTQIFEALFTPLITIDSSDNIHMAQAQSITKSPDGLTYTIKIQ